MRNVYVFGDPVDRSKPVKIGVATDVEARLAAIQTGCPYPLQIIVSFPGDLEHEAHLHNMFADKQTVGEWFLLNEFDIRLITGAAETYMKNLKQLRTVRRKRPTARWLVMWDPAALVRRWIGYTAVVMFVLFVALMVLTIVGGT